MLICHCLPKSSEKVLVFLTADLPVLIDPSALLDYVLSVVLTDSGDLFISEPTAVQAKSETPGHCVCQCTQSTGLYPKAGKMLSILFKTIPSPSPDPFVV